MSLNLHNVLLQKKMIIYTTGENLAIIDQHPIGGGEGAYSLIIMPYGCMEPQRVWFLIV